MGNNTIILMSESRVHTRIPLCTEIFETWRMFSESIVRNVQGLLKRKIDYSFAGLHALSDDFSHSKSIA